MFLIILIVLLCTHIVHIFGIKNKYSILLAEFIYSCVKINVLNMLKSPLNVP